MTTTPQKISFGEMRGVGVRDVLIYCRFTDAATRRRSAPTAGPIMSGCHFSPAPSVEIVILVALVAIAVAVMLMA